MIKVDAQESQRIACPTSACHLPRRTYLPVGSHSDAEKGVVEKVPAVDVGVDLHVPFPLDGSMHLDDHAEGLTDQPWPISSGHVASARRRSDLPCLLESLGSSDGKGSCP